MRIRPLAAVAAAALVAGLVGPAVAAAAPAAPRPAAGTATSELTLLGLALAGHDVRVGSVALVSDTVSGRPAAKVVVTPVRADGKAYGEQTVTPANSPGSVPSFDSAAVLPPAVGTLASVKSPVFTVSSSTTSGASAEAGAASLGSASILGLPVTLNGTVDVSSLVNGSNATGSKTVSVKGLALPSIADLLGALGLNLKAVPIKTLTDLLAGLGLADTAVTTAQQALATAEAALGTALTTAQADVDAAQAKLDAAKVDLATRLTALDQAKVPAAQRQQALADAQAQAAAADQAKAAAQASYDSTNAAIAAAAGALPGSAVFNAYLLANPTAAATLQAATDSLNNASAAAATAAAALAAAQTAAQAATAAVNAAQALVDTAQALVTSLSAVLSTLLATLNGLLGQVAPQVNALLAAVTAVLDRTPLVSVDSFTVRTQALVTSARPGGQSATVVGGEIQGVHVLGTDVLKNVLGNTRIDVLDLTGSVLSQVTAKVDALTGVLSSVLSTVPGLTVPAPKVRLLTKSTSTSIAGGFGTAQNSVQALSISIPAITLPAGLALPNAASLPGISGVPDLKGTLGIAAVGDLTSKPITLGVGTLSEQASFRPAVTSVSPAAPPRAGTPQLATTGLPAGAAVLGLLLVGFALVVRRRFTAQA